MLGDRSALTDGSGKSAVRGVERLRAAKRPNGAKLLIDSALLGLMALPLDTGKLRDARPPSA